MEKDTIEVQANETKEVAVFEEKHENGVVAIFDTSPAAFYSSVQNQSFEDRAKTLAALGNPDYKLADIADKNVLCVTDVVAHKVKLTDMNTGEVRPADRVVLLLANGQTVAGVSDGFKQSLQNVFSLFGRPSWLSKDMPNGLPLVVNRVACKKGNTYNVNVAVSSPLPLLGKAGK